MIRKTVSAFMIAVLCVVGMSSVAWNVQAGDGEGLEVDSSFLVTSNASVGETPVAPQGVYLMKGDSTISKIDSRTAAAGGSTTASVECNISIGVIVEQLNSGSWIYWTSWSVSKVDEAVLLTGRVVPVTPGYYYRVRCTHRAATDGSSSWTGGLYF